MGLPDTQNLSSNWKQLQSKLKASSSSPSILTKKRSSSAVHIAGRKSRTPPPSRKRRTQEIDSSAPKGLRSMNRPTTSSSSATPDLDNNSTTVSASLALWAEDNDIAASDLARAYNLPLNATALPSDVPLTGSKTGVGKFIAIDCEMVGVAETESALARVSIVNYHGHCVLDTFVRPKEKVTDWRTWVSGVKPSDMVSALTFQEAQKRVAGLMEGRVLVGHAIKNDLRVLLIGHPTRDIRDTSRHPPFRRLSKGRTPGLKKLAKDLLGIEIQGGKHSSIEDARACMLLYRRHKQEFEKLHAIAFPSRDKVKRKGAKK